MEYYHLENSDKNFSNLALGCWQLSKKGWKGVNLSEATKTLHLAIESGITILENQLSISSIIKKYNQKANKSFSYNPNGWKQFLETLNTDDSVSKEILKDFREFMK